jgi:peptide/nickel transport system permease protein
VVCILIALMGIFGPLIAPYPPNAINVLAANQGPSIHHLLGTDPLGRDIFSRVLAGARISLLGPAIVTVISSVVGTTLAITGAWRGGRTDELLARGLDILFAFPGLLIAVLAVAVFGPGLVAPALALSIAYTPYIARIVHAVAVRERHLPYVESCQLMGYSPWRTCSRHLLRNVQILVAAQAALTFGYALLDLSGLSFIGLGVQPPASDWGLMVSDGAVGILNGAPQEAFAAGTMIVITVVSLNVLGETFIRRAEAAR